MVENLTSKPDDGTNFGQSAADKIGFYGLTTPIVQQAAISTLATGTLGDANAAIVVLENVLRNLGLIAAA